MARDNQTGRGRDQKGFEYEVSYQPDWFKALRVTRKDSGGQESTATIFGNPEPHAKGKKPKKVKTRVKSADGHVDFTIDVDDPDKKVKSIMVAYAVPADRSVLGAVSANGDGDEEVVTYTVAEDQPPPPPEGPGGGGG